MVKIRLLAVTCIATFGVSFMAIDPKVEASGGDYVCAQQQKVWTTFVRTPRGLSPLIRWTNHNIQGWPPKKRCMEVSQRMQRLSDNGVFNYAVGSVFKNQPVLCGVRLPGDDCDSKNVIVTLPPGLSPDQAADQLLNVTSRSKGKVLEVSGTEGLRSEVNGSTYINMTVLKEVIDQPEPESSPTNVP